MEVGRRRRGKGNNNNNNKADVEWVLRKSWYHLRLSVRHPSRVPTWDAIVLTAASPEQAKLYDWQLSRAKRMGRISPSTITLSVPDPGGHRIGSGAATLNAIHALQMHMGSSHSVENSHILVVHAGGDSKRVPWANPMGKVFLPLPYLAGDDPDAPVPLLFDHLLAIASAARQALGNGGAMFTMTGDVLPCFDASRLVLPDDSPSILTVPITLDIASNHGVVVAPHGVDVDVPIPCLVDNLLQKPSLEELVNHNAILEQGTTLLDTGLIAVKGKAWVDLARLACSSQSLISDLLNSEKEMSLYEDLVAAWVPAKHGWLQQRPLGQQLITQLGKHRMFSYCASDLTFLHFGTSGEMLDHLSGFASGIVARRHLCAIPATTFSDIAASAVVLSSKIAPGVSVGEDSLIYDSTISSGIQIGSLCIVVGINIPEAKAGGNGGRPKAPPRFILPDRHCLWEVPLVECSERILVFCGLHDNPKNLLSRNGTFCGKPWRKVMHDLGIEERDLWNLTDNQEKCLWNAKIFPILSYSEMLSLATWLMGLNDHRNEKLLSLWRSSRRVSLEELHRSIDFSKMCRGSSAHQAELASGIAEACISYGLLGRNLAQLCDEILQMEAIGIEKCRGFLNQCLQLQDQNSRTLPKSRAYQVQLDLLRSCGDEENARKIEDKVWAAVADETVSAVRYGFREHLLESPSSLELENSNTNGSFDEKFYPRMVTVELPVRVDFVGGWSDTPPWSLERAGGVLNMAISLDHSLPIGTVVETIKGTGLLMSDDAGNHLYTEDLSSIKTPFSSSDPFRLVKSAMLVTGLLHHKVLLHVGLRVRTWANIPRGSGLGTSSILAAAVVKGFLKIIDGDESKENVARLVLVLEQIMGTGGGWQDQIGGLYPGIKFTTSFPGVPLRLQVVPLLASSQLISELQQRLLVVFTGQVRLAHQVLQKVVTRYLKRDNLLISSIKRLVELAKIGREALMNCNVDEVGEIMMETWQLHQELDPYCSNEYVDRLFAFADPYCCGYKLVGAGGGGFALLLAKSRDSASKLRELLEGGSEFDVKVYNWEVYVEK